MQNQLNQITILNKQISSNYKSTIYIITNCFHYQMVLAIHSPAMVSRLGARAKTLAAPSANRYPGEQRFVLKPS
jgi:hypothetical protein